MAKERNLVGRILMGTALIGSLAYGANSALDLVEKRRYDANEPVTTYYNNAESNPKDNLESKAKKKYVSTLRSDLRRHEGVKYVAYDDSKGIRTVGIGFNLERKDAKGLIEKVGANYEEVFNKKQRLTEDQVEKILDFSIEEARGVAKRYLGDKSYDGLKEEAKDILVNMAFMGEGSLNKFKKLRIALKNKDYLKASEEMKDSKWYSDVKTRGVELVERMKKLSEK